MPIYSVSCHWSAARYYTNRVYIVITTWSYTLIHSTYFLYDYCVHYVCVCTASKYLGFKDEVNEADSDLALQ